MKARHPILAVALLVSTSESCPTSRPPHEETSASHDSRADVHIPTPPLPPAAPATRSAGTESADTTAGHAQQPSFDHSSGRFESRSVTVSQLVSHLYSEAMKIPYVIAADVLEDRRQVSFRYDAQRGPLRDFLKSFLESLGIAIESRHGVDFVYKKARMSSVTQPNVEAFVYKPRYRNANYLSRQAQPLFKGTFAGGRAGTQSAHSPNGAIAPTGSKSGQTDNQNDTVIFYGSLQEIAALERLLPLIDIPAGEVAIKAVAYEVTHSDDTGSAFHAALKILGNGVAALGGAHTVVGTLSSRLRDFESVLSSLSRDARFKVINEPNLRIRSGSVGNLIVGQEVPTLSALTYPDSGGRPLQSVEYRQAGMIFALRPVVKEDIIDVHITQQISEFVRTKTGVNNSPTLNTREVSTDISVRDGDVILLGGLTTSTELQSRKGVAFLPRMLDAGGISRTKSEILVVLHVQKL